jgi:hypothetical protein
MHCRSRRPDRHLSLDALQLQRQVQLIGAPLVDANNGVQRANMRVSERRFYCTDCINRR